MCFSLKASLTASAILIPIGIYSFYLANKSHRPYLLFSLMPFFFGIQQFCEGLVWHGLQIHHHTLIHVGSLAFLFFAYFWWPVFIPLSVYFIEESKKIKKILLLFFVIGFILGTALYSPILFNFSPLETTTFRHSINYNTYQDQPWISLHILVYVSIIVFSLYLSSVKLIKYLGIIILFSFLVSIFFYLFTFTSVWCFFAALISAYVVYIIRHAPVSIK